jgi:hypothetical protein
MIVPVGGISLDGTRWIGCEYLLPVKVLSRLFRPLMPEMLVAAHDATELPAGHAEDPSISMATFVPSAGALRPWRSNPPPRTTAGRRRNCAGVLSRRRSRVGQT